MSPEEQKLFDIQSPSYKAAMSQSQAERELHRISAVPKEAQCVKEDGSVDLNVRAITAAEAEFYDGDFGVRRKQGARFEEARIAYLSKAISEGKVHESLRKQLETPHVMPNEETRQRAIDAWMGNRTVAKLKERFKAMMDVLFKPQHAEIVADEMRKLNQDDK